MPLTNKASEQQVNNLFSRVAGKYDLMNNIISLGIQKRWRRTFFRKLNVSNRMHCLDLCCGTGDVAIALAKKTDSVVGLDFNQKMLNIAQKKIVSNGVERKIKLVQGDAMKLPFSNNSFDLVTIAFGLRNVPDAGQTIEEARRVLKPDGQFAILEMSQPTNPVIKKGWQFYFDLFPYLAKLTHNQVNDYRYLAQTSAAFLSRRELKHLLQQKGFRKVTVSELTWGAGAIHVAYK